jgi:hypothetical protein
MAIMLTDLNNFMKAYPSGRIELGSDQRLNIALYDLLAKQVNKTAFKGGSTYDFLIETGSASSAQAHRENVDLPTPGTTGFVKATVAMKELIAIASISKQARDFATGGDNAWGNVVAHSIDMMMRDFKNILSVASLGDGTGKLARVASCSSSTSSGFFAGSTYTNTHTIIADNTYTDFGWENVAMLKTGMRVDVWASDYTTIHLADAIVGAVTFGNRANGASTVGAAANSVVLWSTAAAVSPIVDNDVIVLKDSGFGESGTATEGTYYLPMGLTGLISDDTSQAQDLTSTFQGLTRSTCPSLLSRIYQADDFGPGTPSVGLPTTWDLSVISDCINENYYASGKSIDALIMAAPLAMAFSRLNRGNDIVVNTSTQGGAFAMPAAGARLSPSFIGPSGQVIPIMVDPNIPANVLYGVCSDDLAMFTKGDFDYLREYGDIWEPQRDSRKTNYEAPYGGYVNFGAYRSDTSFCIQDLKTNVS